MLEQSFHFGFPVLNNEAEYEALLVGLKLAKAVEANKIKAWSDSQLIVIQIKVERYQGRKNDCLPQQGERTDLRVCSF